MPRGKAPISPQELLRKADYLYDEGKYTESLKASLECSRIKAGPSLTEKEFCELYNLIGLSYYNNGHLTEAVQNIQKSLEYAIKCEDNKLIYTRYENLAAIFSGMQRHQTAIEHLQKAIDLKENGGFYKDVGRSLLQLSSFYSSL